MLFFAVVRWPKMPCLLRSKLVALVQSRRQRDESPHRPDTEVLLPREVSLAPHVLTKPSSNAHGLRDSTVANEVTVRPRDYVLEELRCDQLYLRIDVALIGHGIRSFEHLALGAYFDAFSWRCGRANSETAAFL
jgi:hypothetical protein